MRRHFFRVRQRRPLSVWISLVWMGLLLAGCASTKDTVLPQDGPTMKSIYDQHMMRTSGGEPRQKVGGPPLPASGIQHYHGFVREAANEIDTIFPRLPNPTLVMYVYPHLSSVERTPVPGYVTTFPLYTLIEYALPGEVPTTGALPEGLQP